MSTFDFICKPLCPSVRNPKNIIFNGSKYPIDFDLLVRYSNYFFNHKQDYEKVHDIIFPNKPIEINEEIFQTFLKICQGEEFILNDSNVFIIRQLSYIYDIPDLANSIKIYISKHPQLVLKSLYNLISNEDNKSINKDDEETVSANIFEIIDNEHLLKLRVSSLFRILNQYELHIDQLDDEKQKIIIDFLFKYLEKHPKEGSVLFMSIKDMKIDTMLRIIEDYSDVFDFHMINSKSLFKIAIDTTCILNESKGKFIDQNKIIIQLLKTRINKFNEKIDEFTGKITIKLNSFSGFINKVNLFKEKCAKLYEINNKMKVELKDKEENIQKLQKRNEKMNQIISDINPQTFLTQNENISMFNNLKGESQCYFISKIKEQNKNELISKISNLLQYLSNEHDKAHYPNNNNYIHIWPKCIKDNFNSIKEVDSIEINSHAVETLYKNGSLNSTNFLEQINNFENIVVEILYPSNDFENIFNCLMNLKKEKNLTFKIGVHYIKYENCYYFQKKNKNIFSVKLDCEEIFGGKEKGIFEGNDSLEKLIISDKVKKIGDGSFFNCVNLKYIIFGKNITNIGNSAFSNCTQLDKIELNNNETENFIHEFAFKDCSKLKYIKCNPYITKINKNSFDGCPQLNKLIFSSFLDSTCKHDFVNYERFTEIIIPDTINKIGSESFKDFQFLKSISIPSSVKIIEDNSFYNCKKLEQIELSSSLTSIGKESFYGCSSLKQIIIPQQVRKIGESAFLGCTALQSVTFVFPSFLADIGSRAFERCTSLEQISIPYPVTKLNSSCFRFCTSLHKIEVNVLVTEIGEYCFEDCKSLTEVIFKDLSSVKSIGECAFKGCSSLKEISIPEELTAIEKALFQNCTSLTRIIIPPFVKTIGELAFEGCSSMTAINMPFSVESFGITSFFGCSSIEYFDASYEIYDKLYNYSIYLSDKNRIKEFGAEAFRYVKIAADCGNVDAMYKCYLMCSKGDENEMKYLKMAADNYHADAMNIYGCKLHEMHKIDQDFREAFQYFLKSADEGNSYALYNCGLYYEFGYGTSKNYRKSLDCYESAKKEGHKNAQDKIVYIKTLLEKENSLLY